MGRPFWCGLVFVLLVVMVLLPGVTFGATYDTGVVEVETDTGIQKDTVTVKVSDTPYKRSRGLRIVDRLDTGTGMLFVFESSAIRTFTMVGMGFPLDIVFLDAEGIIHTIRSVKPGVERVPSGGPAKWVLEVRKGWARQNDIKIGDRVRGLPRETK